MNKTLQMVFSTEEGRNATMTISDPVEPVVALDVEGAMDIIVTSGAFQTNSGLINGKVRASLIAREVTPVLEF